MISSKESKHPEIVELIKTRILGYMTATTYVLPFRTLSLPWNDDDIILLVRSTLYTHIWLELDLKSLHSKTRTLTTACHVFFVLSVPATWWSPTTPAERISPNAWRYKHEHSPHAYTSQYRWKHLPISFHTTHAYLTISRNFYYLLLLFSIAPLRSLLGKDPRLCPRWRMEQVRTTALYFMDIHLNIWN
jgi:hypothetical protein